MNKKSSFNVELTEEGPTQLAYTPDFSKFIDEYVGMPYKKIPFLIGYDASEQMFKILCEKFIAAYEVSSTSMEIGEVYLEISAVLKMHKFFQVVGIPEKENILCGHPEALGENKLDPHYMVVEIEDVVLAKRAVRNLGNLKESMADDKEVMPEAMITKYWGYEPACEWCSMYEMALRNHICIRGRNHNYKLCGTTGLPFNGVVEEGDDFDLKKNNHKE